MDICDKASEELEYAIKSSITLSTKTKTTHLGTWVDGKKVLCVRCGRPIPKKRLKVLPNTNICVHCAEMIQQGHTFDDFEEDELLDR